MTIHLETPRCIIRELRLEDEEGMFAMDSDPQVHLYLGKQPIQSRNKAREYIELIHQQYADYGIGRWAVIDKETNEFLGWTGFKFMDKVNGRTDTYDFGYRFRRSAWGRGIATETGKIALEYGVRNLGLKPVHAMTDVNNKASMNVLEKLGFRFVEIFDYDGPNPQWLGDNLRATWYELPETFH